MAETKTFNEFLREKNKSPHAFFVSIKDLVINERARKEFSKLEGLRDSIAKVGCIQPPVVLMLPEGKYRLMAGERRTRCMLMLGATEIPVVTREFASELEQLEVEFDENFHRENLTWIEQAALYKRIDEHKKKTLGTVHSKASPEEQKAAWSTVKTAALVGEEPGHVGKKIKLAKAIEADPSLKAKLENMPWTTAYKMLTQKEEAETLQKKVDAGEVKLTKSIKLGDARTLIKEVPSESIALLLWDPPFGTSGIEELEGVGTGSVQTYLKTLAHLDNLSLPEAIALISELAPEISRVLKPGGYFFIFHQADLYASLRNIFTLFDFEYDPTPLIWDKGRPTAPDRGYTFMPSYEPIFYGVKQPWSRRLSSPSRNIVQFSPISSKLKHHPFEKPLDLLAWIIKEATLPGETVLDLCCGSGATVFAAEDTRRSGIGFELSPERFAAAMVWDQERKLGKV